MAVILSLNYKHLVFSLKYPKDLVIKDQKGSLNLLQKQYSKFKEDFKK